MSYVIIVLILLLAIFLFLAEIFILPGLSIAGIAGVAVSICGIAYAYFTFGTTGMIITLITGILLFILLFYLSLKSKIFDSLALKKDIKSTVADKNLKNIAPGNEVLTVSRLNPMGKVVKDNDFFEAKSESGYIDEDRIVFVKRVEGNTIIVSLEKPNISNNTEI
ncbi:MAG: NfeD family protein [Bacteroidales bacterium]